MSLLRRTPTRAVAGRAAPWLIAAGVSREARDHWNAQLTPRQRKRLLTLLKKSGGRPSSLPAREEREMRRLVAQLDLKAFAKHAAGTVVAGRAKQHTTRGR